MICLLDQWDFCQDPRFELPFLLVIGSLLDVCYLEPIVLKEVLSCGSGVIVYVQASLEDVDVLSCYLLVIDVIGSSLDSPVEVVICLPSEWEAAV